MLDSIKNTMTIIATLNTDSTKIIRYWYYPKYGEF